MSIFNSHNNRVYILTAGAVLVASHTPSLAQSRPQYLDGLYVAGQLGAAEPSASATSRSGATSTTNFKRGIMGTASAGYGFGNGVRVEAELSHRRNKVQSVENGNPALDRTDGRSSVTGFLGNVIYDIYTPSNFTPFVGVGAGAARVHAQNAGPDAQGNFVTGSEIVPAYQGLVGLNYQTSETVAVGITYRYFKAGDATLGSNPASKVTVPYKDKSLTFGLVYAFNPRVPVPTPSARAATQRPVPIRGGEMLQDEPPARPQMLQSSIP